MKNIEIDERYSFMCKSVSKGAQKKYFKDGWYYKVDRIGREGMKEWLVSCILECSNLASSDYVRYEACTINGKPGCRSYNFLDKEETFIPIKTIFTSNTGMQFLADYLPTLGNAEERLEYILKLAEPFVGREAFRTYLCRIVQLDMLIENTDRHEFNYGVIKSPEGYRVAPIFDNGDCLHDGAPCTLCGSFQSQVTAFGFPVIPAFTINYRQLEERLKNSEFSESAEVKRLHRNLKEYEYLFSNSMNLPK